MASPRILVLGAGRNAVADLGITTIADALHFRVTDVAVLEAADDSDEDTCVRITMRSN